MVQYTMMPLNDHYDSGFGAIAEAFRSAAIRLKEVNPNPAFFEHLPQSYLFRHAVELFLKSEIVIVHRKLRIPYGTESYDGAPMVPEGGEWKMIHRVHGVGTLYEHWKELIVPRTEELKEMCRYRPDWTIQTEADGWINTIEATDPRSTYSRYPATRDRDEDRSKSPFKQTAPEDIFPPERSEDKKIMALVIENTEGDFVNAYVLDKGVESDAAYMAALEQATDMLFNYHAMMRFELTRGF